MADYYYRQVNTVRFGPGALTPVVRNLLIANAAVFAVQVVFFYSLGGYNQGPHYQDPMSVWFGLNPAHGVFRGMVWQLGTYMFLHAVNSPLHILFNMFYLWMFGVSVEQRMGSRAFAWMYFVSGLGAGVLTCLFWPFWNATTIGASGAVFGVLLAYGLLFPNRMILLFFIIPVKAIFMSLGLIAIEVMYMITSVNDGVAHITHVSGAGFAYLFLRYQNRILDAAPRAPVVNPAEAVRRVKEKAEQMSEAEEQRRVDEILDKINRQGIHTLSRNDRAFLKRRARRRDRD